MLKSFKVHFLRKTTKNQLYLSLGLFFFQKSLWGEQLYGSFPVCDIELSCNQLKPRENGL